MHGAFMKSSKPSMFIAKLYQMVSDPGVKSITWAEEDSILVKDAAALENDLMKYYRHNNFGSFSRQLHMYGFRVFNLAKNRQGVSHWHAWQNENFRPGREDLLLMLERKKPSKKARSNVTDSSSPSYSDEVIENMRKKQVVTSARLKYLEQRNLELETTVNDIQSQLQKLSGEFTRTKRHLSIDDGDNFLDNMNNSFSKGVCSGSYANDLGTSSPSKFHWPWDVDEIGGNSYLDSNDISLHRDKRRRNVIDSNLNNNMASPLRECDGSISVGADLSPFVLLGSNLEDTLRLGGTSDTEKEKLTLLDSRVSDPFRWTCTEINGDDDIINSYRSCASGSS